MTDTPLSALTRKISETTYRAEAPVLQELISEAALSPSDRDSICAAAADLVRQIRSASNPGLMEVFLAEYGLSTNEGIALMCLAEALLRVPDAQTIDALIEDKIAPSDWGRHLGHSSSSLVNASTWALMLTGKVLEDREPGIAGHLRGAVKRLGEPVIRTAVARAMKEMGRQFVLGETISAAMKRASGMESKGYSYSYDMLGEAARTDADARRYHLSYSRAISAIAAACTTGDIRSNPGISVKLSALHPRYEHAQRDRVMAELVPRVRSLAQLAKSAGMGFNIDAEEADRLSLSLEVIEAVLSDKDLAGWDGFGIVVQAYGQRAGLVIDWIYALAERLDRRFMVRLVKGAYWDSEIKLAQVNGMGGFPVFTRKSSTDISYIANARKLLGMTNRIYPQFATHNAHTVAAILHMAGTPDTYEFQRLHGMGEQLHDIVKSTHGTRCRIYAPVGEHRDLLAYLVRRLLENGANSSFVNQIVDEDVAPEVVAADPFAQIEAEVAIENPVIATAPALYGTARRNSEGFDLAHQPTLDRIETARAPFRQMQFSAAPAIAANLANGAQKQVHNPADDSDLVGTVQFATPEQVNAAIEAATPWDAPTDTRAAVLERASQLYEDNFGEIFALLGREAGKTLPDAVGELREAVDFLRFYATEAKALSHPPAGVFTCISPWNFPLAIFTGQIAAALATGNAVLAKPSEQTCLIADLAVRLLHKAGVPKSALQLLPGDGKTVGAAITSNAKISGVAFTGSTQTAQTIRRAMAEHLAPGAPLIAETGGLNAMIVDSTALPEQAVADVIQSAFQSAGQRCSALRCLYVQEDIAEKFSEMLFGAMDELTVGQPWDLSCDIGPLIDENARSSIADYVGNARAKGQVLKELERPDNGTFLAPTALRIGGIDEMAKEVFGPVLHIATFRADQIDRVIDTINATGYGLTFGLHTRIDDRVQHIVERLKVGNIYVNRNQIGAVVGSQPFGGEGLSGTGPKAGGPQYLHRFCQNTPRPAATETPAQTSRQEVQEMIDATLTGDVKLASETMPGPTGESNQLSLYPRLPVLCLGPGADTARQQAEQVKALGGVAVALTALPTPDDLVHLSGFSAAVLWADDATARPYAQALALRAGAILPLITGDIDSAHVLLERHVCIDTTASGGNAALLAEVGSA